MLRHRQEDVNFFFHYSFHSGSKIGFLHISLSVYPLLKNEDAEMDKKKKQETSFFVLDTNTKKSFFKEKMWLYRLCLRNHKILIKLMH